MPEVASPGVVNKLQQDRLKTQVPILATGSNWELVRPKYSPWAWQARADISLR